MADELTLSSIPPAQETYMLVGWEQWADAGSVSSALPKYLIDLTSAEKIGEFGPDGYYLFQVPGTHHFLRPVIKLEGGHRKELSSHQNQFYYSGNEQKGLVIFQGEEPHLNVDAYANVLFDAVEQLGVRRVIAVGGVYGAMPYDKERRISCIYSLPGMKGDLGKYAVAFSDYEGGVTIGTYLASRAEERNIEFVVMYAFVPAYDFSELSNLLSGVRIEQDYKAWYDIMRRVNYMCDLHLDLSDLESQGIEVTRSMAAQIAEIERSAPGSKVRDYLKKVDAEFEEVRFMPLDIWEEGLDDVFKDIDSDR